MTLRVIMNEKYAAVFIYNKSRARRILTFELPHSFDEFKLWYDLKQFKIKKIQFEDSVSHRKICQLSKSKFEKLDFPELERIRKLMMCDRKDLKS